MANKTKVLSEVIGKIKNEDMNVFVTGITKKVRYTISAGKRYKKPFSLLSNKLRDTNFRIGESRYGSKPYSQYGLDPQFFH